MAVVPIFATTIILPGVTRKHRVCCRFLVVQRQKRWQDDNDALVLAVHCESAVTVMGECGGAVWLMMHDESAWLREGATRDTSRQ